MFAISHGSQIRYLSIFLPVRNAFRGGREHTSRDDLGPSLIGEKGSPCCGSRRPDRRPSAVGALTNIPKRQLKNTIVARRIYVKILLIYGRQRGRILEVNLTRHYFSPPAAHYQIYVMCDAKRSILTITQISLPIVCCSALNYIYITLYAPHIAEDDPVDAQNASYQTHPITWRSGRKGENPICRR